MWNKRDGLQLKRYPRAGLIAGVCAGIAAHFGWNAKLIRVLAVLGLFFGGVFPVAIVYLVLWYLMEVDRGEPHAVKCTSGSSPQDPAESAHTLQRRYARMEQRLRDLETCVASREFELRRELGKLG